MPISQPSLGSECFGLDLEVNKKEKRENKANMSRCLCGESLLMGRRQHITVFLNTMPGLQLRE